MKSFGNFTQQYSLSKTIRFTLKPIGQTAELIKSKGLLKADEMRAQEYQQAKRIIDEFHKEFISDSLSDFWFNLSDLESFSDTYLKLQKNKKDDTLKASLKTLQNKLRLQVAEKFQKQVHKITEQFQKEQGGSDKVKPIFKIQKKKNKKTISPTQDLIKSFLPQWLEANPVQIEGITDSKALIGKFKNWTTYFSGFNENRENIYTEESKATAISFRIVHDNLPKFIDNIERYQKAKELGVDFSEIEKNFGIHLDKVFSLEYFNDCLSQVEIEFYNQIRGAHGLNTSKENQGINQKINLHAQQLESKIAHANDGQKKQLVDKRKAVRTCKLEELYKQILSDRIKPRLNIEQIKNDSELCQLIEHLFRVKNNELIGKQELAEGEEQDFEILGRLHGALKHLSDADPERIYVSNGVALGKISGQLFGQWNIIKDSLAYYVANSALKKDAKGKSKLLNEKEQETWLKTPYFSFAEIHLALEKYFASFDEDELEEVETKSKDTRQVGITKEMKKLAEPLFDYFTNLEHLNGDNNEILPDKIIQNYKRIEKEVLHKYRDIKEEKLKKEKYKDKKGAVELIKDYLDSIKALQEFLRPMQINLRKQDEKKAEAFAKDNSFYDDFDVCYKTLSNIIPLYNQTRNYLTKKPYSTEKYKLNFDKHTLLNGFADSPEGNTQYFSFIFRKAAKFYLGVTNNTKLFDRNKHPEAYHVCSSPYQKMVYKQLDAKTIYGSLYKGLFDSKYSEDKQHLSEKDLIQNIKKVLEKKEKDFPQIANIIQQIDNDDISELNELVNAISAENFYNIAFVDVNSEYVEQGTYLDEKNKEYQLYLFEIYNKDFSEYSKGKPNLHTMYWKSLFSEENLSNVIYKLSGNAEIFYRKPSIVYSPDVWKKGHHADEAAKKQPYPIIKDRRYAQETFLFHVPITLNAQANSRVLSKDFNEKTNEYLKNNPNVNIIGIDRGERHLAYYTVVNQEGKILQDKNGGYLQGTLNVVESQYKDKEGEQKVFRVDYHEKLAKREKERLEARESWGTIERIKDLKEGYLSQVVQRLAMLMVEHNAIIVFEDLNFGFKRGRFKVEKQVYQKLEKMLIDKLNYLVFKGKSSNELGGLNKALQLTAPFQSFQKLGKQSGFIFYVPAHYTSKICPLTGFVNMLYPKYYTVKKAQDFLGKFDNIHYNNEKNYFEFAFSYEQFTEKMNGNKLDWVLCSHGKRLENKRAEKHWQTEEMDITERLKALFDNYEIDYSENKNIKDLVAQQTERDFHKKMIHLLKLTLQMRNSRIGTDEDWMISPIWDEKTKSFFDSREAGADMPQDADANGAYHIALKGLWVLEQLKAWEKDGNEILLAISNQEWFDFVQAKPYLKKT